MWSRSRLCGKMRSVDAYAGISLKSCCRHMGFASGPCTRPLAAQAASSTLILGSSLGRQSMNGESIKGHHSTSHLQNQSMTLIIMPHQGSYVLPACVRDNVYGSNKSWFLAVETGQTIPVCSLQQSLSSSCVLDSPKGQQSTPQILANTSNIIIIIIIQLTCMLEQV